MISRATMTGLVLLSLWGCDAQTPTTGAAGSSGDAPPAESRQPDASAGTTLPSPGKDHEAIPGAVEPQPDPQGKSAR